MQFFYSRLCSFSVINYPFEPCYILHTFFPLLKPYVSNYSNCRAVQDRELSSILTSINSFSIKIMLPTGIYQVCCTKGLILSQSLLFSQRTAGSMKYPKLKQGVYLRWKSDIKSLRLWWSRDTQHPRGVAGGNIK